MTCESANGKALSSRERILNSEENVCDLHRLAIATDEVWESFSRDFSAAKKHGIEICAEQLSELMDVLGANISSLRIMSRDVRSALFN
ncbi:hypothetical protein [Brucella tritici]|uniref:hypothetical protein n=1 Tax=Brucella tritici TaxID=94626 RepID=UPI002001853E|nr:hypothetical protein [Brucella tritici]